MHRVAHVDAPPSERRRVRVVLVEVRVLELDQREVQLLDQRLELARRAPRGRSPAVRSGGAPRRAAASSADRRRRLGLDVDVDDVLLGEHLIAGLELALGQHLVFLERGDRLLRRSATAARRASYEVGQAALLGLLVPRLGVAVAVEDDLLVGGPDVLDDGVTAFSSVGRAFQRGLRARRRGRRSTRRRSC